MKCARCHSRRLRPRYSQRSFTTFRLPPSPAGETPFRMTDCFFDGRRLRRRSPAPAWFAPSVLKVRTHDDHAALGLFLRRAAPARRGRRGEAARWQGREPRGDDARRAARAAGLHDHDGSLPLLLRTRRAMAGRTRRANHRASDPLGNRDGPSLRQRARTAFRVRAFRRGVVHAGHDGHDFELRHPSRPRGGGRRHAAVLARVRAVHRDAREDGQRRVAPRGRAVRGERPQVDGRLRRARRAAFSRHATGAAHRVHQRRLQLMDQRARDRLSQAPRPPRTRRHGGEHPGDVSVARVGNCLHAGSQQSRRAAARHRKLLRPRRGGGLRRCDAGSLSRETRRLHRDPNLLRQQGGRSRRARRCGGARCRGDHAFPGANRRAVRAVARGRAALRPADGHRMGLGRRAVCAAAIARDSRT